MDRRLREYTSMETPEDARVPHPWVANLASTFVRARDAASLSTGLVGPEA